MELLSLRGVEVGYHRRRILPAFDLTISRGTFVGIVGQNGSGKTTIVRTMLGLLPPVSGRVEHPLKRAPRFGYVPQRPDLDRAFPISALDMVMMGRYPRVGRKPWVGAADKKVAMQAIERVSLTGLERRSLHTLSGGQRQRALIARALVSDPEILVLDEPTTGMDLVAEQALLELVESLRTQLKLGVVMISHHLGLVANYVHEVLLVDRDRNSLIHGDVQDVVTPEKLSALYGQRVAVEEVKGHRVIFLQPPRGFAPDHKEQR
jgi:ABC-type Mn2+/Zn2+ transport system ATPase subunit